MSTFISVFGHIMKIPPDPFEEAFFTRVDNVSHSFMQSLDDGRMVIVGSCVGVDVGFSTGVLLGPTAKEGEDVYVISVGRIEGLNVGESKEGCTVFDGDTDGASVAL
jgi:hypothetical protein